MSDFHSKMGDVPCRTCGKLSIINTSCDNHCIRPNCVEHFPNEVEHE